MRGNQRVNCVLFHYVCCVCVLHCKHSALYGCAMQSHTKQCAGADMGEICVVYKQVSPPSEILGDHQV
ncbi:unnamed protein product, partial [Staurois parvus]